MPFQGSRAGRRVALFKRDSAAFAYRPEMDASPGAPAWARAMTLPLLMLILAVVAALIT
jgi:hypothetical protein